MKPENRGTSCLLGAVSLEFYKLGKFIQYNSNLSKTHTDLRGQLWLPAQENREI